MTGLNLETFLHLLRADLGAWASLGAIVLVLALMAWTSWGSRKVLRKCLVLSVVAHLGLALFGSTLPMRLLGLRSREPAESSPPGIQQVRVIPHAEEAGEASAEGRRGRRAAAWDRPDDLLALADPEGPSPRPDPPAREPLPRSQPAPLPVPADPARPEPAPPSAPSPETRPAEESTQEPSTPPAQVTPSDPNEIAAPVVAARDAPEPATPPDEAVGRLRPDLAPARAPEPQAEAVRTRPPLAALSTPPALVRPDAGVPGAPLETRPREATPPAGEVVPPEAVVSAPDPVESGVASEVRMRPGSPQPASTLPEADIRRRSRPSRVEERGAGPGTPRRGADAPGPIALSRVAPAGLPRLPEVQGTPGRTPPGRRPRGVPVAARPQSLGPGRTRRRQRGQRAGRRTGARLADAAPGQRRPLGRRDRQGRRRRGLPRRRRLHHPLPPRRALLRRVHLLGGRHRVDRPGPAGVPGGGLHPDRRQVRRHGGQGARLPARGAEARRRPARDEPGRRHVLPRHGHARPVRGLRADGRRTAQGPGRAGRRLHRPVAGPRRHGLAIRAGGPRRAIRASSAGWSWP